MNLPNVKHPKAFKIGNVTVQVLTRMPITDAQAVLIVRLFERQKPAAFRSRTRQTLTLPWPGDQAALEALEAAAEHATSSLLDLLKPAPRRPRH
jgi:hypothetical protein